MACRLLCMYFIVHICTVDSLQETYEQKRSEHLKEMQAREERMRQMFVQKVCQLMPVYYT